MDQMPEFAAPIKQVREGCVEIIFRVPACFKDITSLTSNQIEQLRSNGICDVTVRGKHLMKVCHSRPCDHHIPCDDKEKVTTDTDTDEIFKMSPNHDPEIVPEYDPETAPKHDHERALKHNFEKVLDHNLETTRDCNPETASDHDPKYDHKTETADEIDTDNDDSVVSSGDSGSSSGGNDEFSAIDSGISSGDDSDGEWNVNINYALLRTAPSTEDLTMHCTEQGHSSLHTAGIDDHTLVIGASDQQAAKDKEKKLAEQAVFEGNLQEIKHQIGNIDTQVKDELLLLAVKKGQTEIIRFFLNEQHCDPNIEDKDGQTPLTLTKNKETMKMLLQHGAIAQDVYTKHRKTLGRIFSKDPLKNPVKMFVIGHGGAGKSTLIEALEHEPTFWTSLVNIFIGPKEVERVDQRTAGIIPRTFKSRYYGDVQFYDFAGQEAYYSSHAAVIKSVVDTSSPIFMFVIDISKEDTTITQSVSYWLGIIAIQCGNMEGQAPLIVVGSHADQIKDQSIIDHKKQIISQAVKQFPLFTLAEIISLDCRFSNSDSMKILRRSVGISCDSVRAKMAVSLNSHMLLIYLLDNFPNEIAITLKELKQKIELDTTSEKYSKKHKQTLTFIPTTIPRLMEICIHLNDKGHILFLLNTSSPDKSFIIIDTTKLLAEVIGTIFAPEDFKQHCDIATSTGVVPQSKLAAYFPKLNIDIVIGFLSHLELAVPIEDKEVLGLIDLNSTGTSECYLFCPALIRLTVAENVFTLKEHLIYHFGWILSCSEKDDFLNPRFLHVLFLRIALSLGLAPVVDHDLPALQRRCSVWKTGICWSTIDGIEVLVEVIDKRRVIALFQAPEASLELFQLRSSVIIKILDATREFCPSVTFDQLIIPPNEVKYPLTDFSSIFSLKSVADSIVNQKAHIVSTTGTTSLATADLVEVYSYLGRGILQRLFTGNQKAQKRILSNRFLSFAACWTRNPFLENIIRAAIAKEIPAQSSECTSLEHALKIWRDNTDATYKSLRQILDSLSIFVGQNPLELAGIPPSEMNYNLMQTLHSEDIPYRGGALGCGVTIEDLKRRIGVSDIQLDTEIFVHDIPFVADCFEDVDPYTSALGLTPGQQMDIRDVAFHQGTQSAMAMALKFWHQGNPSAATFKALLQIILTLQRVDVAIIACKYIVDNVPV